MSPGLLCHSAAAASCEAAVWLLPAAAARLFDALLVRYTPDAGLLTRAYKAEVGVVGGCVIWQWRYF